MEKANIHECLNTFDDLFSPKKLAEINDTVLFLVKVQGDDIPWHSHQGDEAFWVLSGEITVYLPDQEIQLASGEFLKIPAGVEHRISANVISELLLVEASEFKHTGEVETKVTKAIFDSLM